jgi:hypothetical protein
MCNNTVRDYGLSVLSSINTSLVTSSYADITVFTTKDEGFPHLLQNFMAYGVLSGAALNAQKSTEFFVSRWRSRSVGISMERIRREISRCLPRQRGVLVTTKLETTGNQSPSNTKPMEESPISYFLSETKTDNQLVGAKLTHVLTILPPPTAFLDTVHRLLVSFIWQGQQWKHPNFVYGSLAAGGISVHRLPSRIKTLRFPFLQNFIASSDAGNAWYFQAWNISTHAEVLHVEDVLKLKLDPSCFQARPPFCANALEAWHNLNPVFNPNIQSSADLRRNPIQNSTLLTSHISSHSLVFGEAWTTLNMVYVENGHWKHIKYINTERCIIPTVRRLAANLKTAEAFIRHHYPNMLLQINSLTSASPSFAIKQPKGN